MRDETGQASSPSNLFSSNLSSLVQLARNKDHEAESTKLRGNYDDIPGPNEEFVREQSTPERRTKRADSRELVFPTMVAEAVT